MYESKSQRPLAPARFLRRVLVHVAAALAMLGASLAVGCAGYVYFEGLSWLDAFLNTSMLLGGMGPVDAPRTAGGELFAGAYALCAGLAFIVAAALILGPLLHRLLHRFHWDDRL